MSEQESNGQLEATQEETQSSTAVEKQTWRTFMKARFAALKASDAALTPPEILKKISQEWRELPASAKLRTSIDENGNKKKSVKRTAADASTVGEATADVSTDTEEDSEGASDKKRTKPVSFGSRHYLMQTLEAFNGTPDKLSIYSTAGQIMKKQNSGAHRESYILPITQSNRSVILKAIRAADAQIQRGEINDLYQALQVGFSIPFSVFRHRA